VGIRNNRRRMMNMLSRVTNPARRDRLHSLCESLREFEDPHFLWKGSTQGGSITSVEVLREMTRQSSATVTIKLILSDGSVRIERSRLQRAGASWVIDIIEVLENNRMQRTAPVKSERRR